MFKNLKLNTKINIALILLVVALIIIIGIIVNYQRKKVLWEKTDNRIKAELQNINTSFNEIYAENKKKVNAANKFANYYFNNLGEIIPQPNYIKMDAVNQLTRKRTVVNLREWKIGGKTIHLNNQLVDKMGELTGAKISIFQKIPRGYIRIATNVTDDDGNRGTGTYIPNSSVIVESVERGQPYIGNSYEYNAWYYSTYTPLYVNGEIKGMLLVGLPQLQQEFFNSIFGERNLNELGYFTMISEDGRLIIHPGREGENYEQSPVFKQLNAAGSKVRSFGYEEVDNKGEKHPRKFFYLYNKNAKAFFAINLKKAKIRDEIAAFQTTFYILSIISIGVFALIVVVFSRKTQNYIELIYDKMAHLSVGKLVNKITVKRTDEIGGIMQSLNRLVDWINENARFAGEIKDGNFNAEFKQLHADDSLGNSLVAMRDSLKETREKEKEREDANQRQQWLNEGLTKFADILRKENREIERLSFNVIRELVKYLDANQGGFYVIEEQQDGEKQIQLYASYAYDQERMLKKTIPWGVGLIGRVIQEQKLLHITEIPDDYVDITSGLGYATPNALLVFPLVANQQVLGAIEVASFKDYSDIQIEFANNIAEDIATTLITVKSNQRTEQLLESSKRQAEELSSQEEEMRQNLEELQATQESAKRNEQEMESIIEALNVTNIVIHFDINGVIEDVNDNFLDLFGADREQLIGVTVDYLIPADDRQEHIKVWEQVKKGEMMQQKTQYVFRDKTVTLHESLMPIANEKGEYYKVLSISALNPEQ